ncbi:sugar ABC transporter substrate-binding protein [Clostridium hydrogenum]|uniref:sugar ABC transporter substrate-binding protein n=1 Tax=Clostridium hydrogenum TaxID=2855764 RepID=UPI001F1C060A|nr:maltose ABC transporter substrate-binding protein [Clostridium hydrogenum]
MKRYAKLLTTVLTAAVIGTSLVGCGSSSTASDSKSGGKTLTVWTHLTKDELPAVQKVADEWGKKTGNKVKVVLDADSNFKTFTEAAQSSKGPDIGFGYPHNNAGVYEKEGLLDEVPSGVINDSDYKVKSVLDGVTWNGKKYGVPIAMETYALFYNTDKVKQAPTTTDELIADAKADGGLQYDVNNFYFSYAWILSNGGYIFKNDNGTLKTDDIGLGNAGAIKGYQFIQDLVKKYNFMKGDIKGDDAKGAFTSGKTAFYISGAWDVAACNQAGVHYAIAKLPQVDGQPGKSFMGVQMAFVNSKSKNKTEAWDLLKALNDKAYDIVYKAGKRIPVKTADLDKDEIKNDKNTQAFIDQLQNAEPMPNIPAMDAVFTATGNDLPLLSQGKLTPQAAAKTIVDQCKQGIAAQQ